MSYRNSLKSQISECATEIQGKFFQLRAPSEWENMSPVSKCNGGNGIDSLLFWDFCCQVN